MFGLGMGEIMVILVVALLVLGPARLPDVANGLGKAIREFRKATKDIQANLEADETVAKPMQDLRVALHGDPSMPLPAPAPVGTVSVAPVATADPVPATVAQGGEPESPADAADPADTIDHGKQTVSAADAAHAEPATDASAAPPAIATADKA